MTLKSAFFSLSIMPNQILRLQESWDKFSLKFKTFDISRVFVFGDQNTELS